MSDQICYIGCTVSEEEKRLIQIKAKEKDMKVSEYIREIILRYTLPDAEPLFTTKQAAHMLGLSRGAIHSLMSKGDLSYVTVGKQKRLFKKDLEEYVKKNYIEQQKDKDDLWTTADIARYLGVTQKTAQKYLQNGYIPAIKTGKIWKAKPDDVKRYKGMSDAHKGKEIYKDKRT